MSVRSCLPRPLVAGVLSLALALAAPPITSALAAPLDPASVSIDTASLPARPGTTNQLPITLSHVTSDAIVAYLAIPPTEGLLSVDTTALDLTLEQGYHAFSGSAVAFRGPIADMTTALAERVSWNPAGEVTAGDAVELSVDVVEAPGANTYYNRDNGHYYRYVATPGGVTWTDAREGAASLDNELFGMTGYLATIASAIENSFVDDYTSSTNVWVGGSNEYTAINAALGESRYASQLESEATWYWVTGPEAGERFWSSDSEVVLPEGAFEAWASGEPNNSGEGGAAENHVLINWGGAGRGWNDYNDVHGVSEGTASGYLVEYGGMGETIDTEQVQTSATLTASYAVPGAPTQVAATRSGSSVTVTWHAPADDGGQPLTGYTATVGSSTCTALPGESTCTVTGVSKSGQAVTVTATNAIGTSAAGTYSLSAVPTAAPAPAPVPESSGRLPDLAPGRAGGTIGNDPAPITVAPVQRGGTTAGLALTGEGFSIELEPSDNEGTSRGRGEVVGDTLKLVRGEAVEVRMSGFRPRSPAQVWIFSEPQFIGEFTTDGTGSLEAALAALPDDLSACQHTLQVVGTLPRGEKAAASLGVWVANEPYPFDDLGHGSVHGPEVGCLADLNITHGYSDGSYRPTQDISRGQLSSLLVRALGLEAAPTTFEDARRSVHGGAIGAAFAAGVASGYDDGTFRPDAKVTRGQAATFLARAAGLDIASVPSGAVNPADGAHAGAIAALEAAGVVEGYRDGQFRPGDLVRRDQFAALLHRLLEYLEQADAQG